MSGWNLALDTSGKIPTIELFDEYYNAWRERADAVSYANLDIVDPAMLTPPIAIHKNNTTQTIVPSVYSGYIHLLACLEYYKKDGNNYYDWGSSGFIYDTLHTSYDCTILSRLGQGSSFLDDGLIVGTTQCTITSGTGIVSGTYTIKGVRFGSLLLENGGYIPEPSDSTSPANDVVYTINGITRTGGKMYCDNPITYYHNRWFLREEFFNITMAMYNNTRYYRIGTTYYDGFNSFEYQP